MTLTLTHHFRVSECSCDFSVRVDTDIERCIPVQQVSAYDMI
jgi:hypothetical protein